MNRALLPTLFSLMLLFGTASAQTYSAGTPVDVGSARLNVRISQLEEQIRSLQGQIEEQGYQIRRMQAEQKQLSEDMDYRMGELEKQRIVSTDESGVPPLENIAGDEPQTPRAVDTSDVPKFDSAREHYNHAFKFLNQANYTEAEKAFEAFIQRYKNDGLIGNAYYWLGETHYVRGDFVQAADKFRAGFEALPNGAKAADNLLKLAMSLSAGDQKDEACIVLEQLVKKYGDRSPATQQKAVKERIRIGCSG